MITTRTANTAKDALLQAAQASVVDAVGSADAISSHHSATAEYADKQLPADGIAENTEHANLSDLLSKVLPFSDFVCRVCERYPTQMYRVLQHLALEQSPPSVDYSALLQQALTDCDNENKLHSVLRQFRQVHMASIAAVDLLHLQDIQVSMAQVSTFADVMLEQAYLWIYQQQSAKYGTPEHHQHMQIMAMGKLGGAELNFSSDIDLIFAYPKSGSTQGAKKTLEHQQFFTKVAQKLIYALDQITEHGRCYRVDMRLRPMGDSGPLVMPYSAIESYYQEQGRAWERYAMQKMRVINSNDDTASLYRLIRPFVYRKYIDFTTIDAIREMKVLIEKEVRRRQLSHNIKLGRGGIREVEFFAQALQLIHAGREPGCQQVSTLKALNALYKYQFISRQIRDELKANYLYLRKVEQFLQIFDDEQTQLLPEDKLNQQRLCTLLGHTSYEQTLSVIEACMSTINKHFGRIIDDANEPKDAEQTEAQSDEVLVYADIWNLSLNQEEVSELLADTLEPEQCAFLFEHLHIFKQKLRSNSISERGMRSINRLMPLLLSELHIENKQLSQNQIKGIFGILLTITGRITYIDLLLENPDVRHRLNTLSRKSLWVAQEISQHPVLLDELLHPVYLQADERSLAEWKTQCEDDLRQYMLRIEPNDVEAVMDTLRQFKHAYQLRVAAADLSGTIAISKVSDKLTLLAEVILAQAVALAWTEVSVKHGVPEHKTAEDKGLGIIAYGKFGGIELSYGSDLDIVCLYDAEQEGQTSSTGTRSSVSHQEFYIKVVQKITHYCITKTYHGILYDIDLRLRPSGNSGLLITHLASFAGYQLSTAWTWEHQALVRTRVVYGTNTFTRSFMQLRANTLSLKRDSAKLREDVCQMRDKMREHLSASKQDQIDLKQSHGGIVDIEFMVQFWVLDQAANYPDLTIWSDNLRVLDVCSNVNIISTEEALALQEHYLWIRHLSHRLQLSGRAFAAPSNKLTQTQQAVSEMYTRVLGS